MEAVKDLKALLQSTEAEKKFLCNEIKVIDKKIFDLNTRYNDVDDMVGTIKQTVEEYDKKISGAVAKYANGEVQESAIEALKINKSVAEGKVETNTSALKLMEESLDQFKKDKKILEGRLDEKDASYWTFISEIEIEKLTPVLQRAWFSANKGHRQVTTLSDGYGIHAFMETLKGKVFFGAANEEAIKKAGSDLTREYIKP